MTDSKVAANLKLHGIRKVVSLPRSSRMMVMMH